MARIVSFAKTIRNNWKKSIFAAGLLSYGSNYAHEQYQINELMRTHCAEAATYGNVTEPAAARLKSVLVIINPTANRRSAQKAFDEYCAPILHLAGIALEFLATDSEGHARRHIEDLETLPHAILVAGGDGTLSETITGLLRRGGGAAATPIGVLPCGRTNSLAQQLFGFSNASSVHEANGLAVAALAVVRGKHIATDVIKIEPLEAEHEHQTKPIFAVGSIQWGAFRDALHLRDKYWYWGPWRDYGAYLLNAFSRRLTWECAAQLSYTPPCAGCSNCWTKPTAAATASQPQGTTNGGGGGGNRRWWSGYSAPKGSGTLVGGTAALPDYSRVLNPACHTLEQLDVQPHELLLRNNARRGGDEVPRLSVQLNGHDLSGVDFVKEGWSRVRGTGAAAPEAAFEVRSMEIRPAEEALHSEAREAFFSIDNEAYEVKPVRVSVVPRAVRVFA